MKKRYVLKVIVPPVTSIEGEGIVVETSFSFLGDVDPDTGIIRAPDSKMKGYPLTGKILFIPTGRGSTVGSYVLYGLAKNKMAPKAIVMHKAEPIIITGAVLGNIPLFENMPIEFYRTPREIRRVDIGVNGEVIVYE